MKCVAFAMLSTTAHTAPRISINYTIKVEAIDTGGKRTGSVSYTNDASIGSMAGIATVNAPAEIVKCGYLGQLSDVTGLVLNSTAPNVNEAAALQLGAWQLLDDTTYLGVPATSVSWSVVAGPITGVSGKGLATAGIVYQNTGATVQGSFGGFTGSLGFTVLDSIADNFGIYAGDGIGDDWQVQYFGQNNPLAAPNADGSGTGQTNFFKYTAGLNPMNPNSRFTLRLENVPGQPGRKNLIFSPRLSDRTYTVKTKPNLTGSYSALTSFSTTDNGQERTVTDLSAGGATKFYEVEITKQ